MLTYSLKTGKITVAVKPVFLDDESDPYCEDYNWAYTVSIQNDSEDEIQVLGRSWRIVDQNGFIQEIKGDNVVGQQPHIKPGEAYEYTSVANLHTNSGVMLGSYNIQNSRGDKMTADIPTFSLDSPETSLLPN